MKKQLVWGSVTGSLQIILNAILIFITIPIFINKLGIEAYSIFSLLLLFGNLNVFVNLGLNTSLIKYLAEQGKSIQSNYDITVSFILLIVVLFPISGISIYFNSFILSQIFNLDQQYITSDTFTLFNLVVISNVIIILGQVFSAVLDAQQKVYLSNGALILYGILYWGLILLSLSVAPGFKFISYSILTSTLVWFVVVFISFKRTWGNFSLYGFRNNLMYTAKKQLSYGVKLYISGSISFFYEPITKVFITQFIGLNEVAFFDIALRIKNQIWNLISKIFYPIFPLISKLEDIKSIRKLIHTVEQKSAFLIIPLAVSIIFISKPLITVWIGNNVDVISITTIFITCAYLIGIIVIPNYQFLMAKGYPEKTIYIQVLNVIVNAFLFLITMYWFNYYAAVISNVGAILSSFALTLYYQKKYLESIIFDNLGQLMKLVLIIIINFLLGLILSEFLDILLIKIIIIPLILAIGSVFSYRALKIFSNEDIDKFSDFNKHFANVTKKILVKN